uniref:Momilactone A synthase n=1 Tax=Aegilops tauschii subsp. strangulata TaxID=200361 RepID=A0A453E409_AEGTS|nr:momilactone A synthase-like [Aegilops tauschii subsp. strangulata]
MDYLDISRIPLNKHTNDGSSSLNHTSYIAQASRGLDEIKQHVPCDAGHPQLQWGEPSCCAPVVAGLIGQCGYSTALSSQRLARKVAVITGAASGIGKATMVEFVRNGAKVVLADVQDDLGRALAAELCADSTSYSRCDVNDEAQVAAVIDLDVACHGKLDIMLNNTGIMGSLAQPELGALDLADFDAVIAINNWASWPGSSTWPAPWRRAARAVSSARPASPLEQRAMPCVANGLSFFLEKTVYTRIRWWRGGFPVG